MIVVRVIVDVQAEHKNEFVKLMQEDRKETMQLDGCQHFDMYQNMEKDNGFIIYEEWESVADFDNYRHSESFKARGEILFPMMDGSPDSLYFTGEKLLEA